MEDVRRNGLDGCRRMENSSESDKPLEGGNPTGGHNDGAPAGGGNPSIPNGVPDAWMDLLGGDGQTPISPDLDGPEFVRPDHLDDEDFEYERPAHLDDDGPDLPPPPEPPEEWWDSQAPPEEDPEDDLEGPPSSPDDPPEEWWDNQGPPDDLCEKGRSGGAPQNGAIPSLGLIHQLLDQISVQLKAQQMMLQQLQQEEFLRGEYRIEIFQKVWEPLFRDHSLKEYIFQLQEKGIQFPVDAVGEKVWAIVSQGTKSKDIVSEWRRQIDLHLGEEGPDNTSGEDQSHE